MSSYFTALLPIRRLFFLSHMQVQLFWITVFVNMVIRPSNSCFCLYTEEPCLATTPFIRPPLASAHLPWSFHADVKISESFYYFEDLFKATTSLLRPGFYGPMLVASMGFHCIFLSKIIAECLQKLLSKKTAA